MADDLPEWAMEQARNLVRNYRDSHCTSQAVWKTNNYGSLFIENDVAAALAAVRRDAHQETAPAFEAMGTALRLIRDAVEELGPAGCVSSRDVGPPDPVGDALDIIAGIQAIILAARREALEEAAKIVRVRARQYLSSQNAIFSAGLIGADLRFLERRIRALIDKEPLR